MSEVNLTPEQRTQQEIYSEYGRLLMTDPNQAHEWLQHKLRGTEDRFEPGRLAGLREAAEALKIEAGALYSETARWSHFAETSMRPGEEASLAEGLRLINERAKKLNAAIEALAKL